MFSAPLAQLHQTWDEVSWRIARLRDNPACADAEHAAAGAPDDPGLHLQLSFDASEDVAAPFVNGARPRVAILREQGVNSQVEMSYAMAQAGFDTFDVHMTDLQAGRARLDRFQGFVACGGFSYGDTLGAGEGWARSILFNARLAEQFAAFFQRGESFALGVCNGCQMMAALAPLIPGAQAWPKFTRNRSEQFEARLSLVEILDSPSLFFAGMAGSRLPIAVAHGEGFSDFSQRGDAAAVHAAMRFVDPRGVATETYPFNPNGSPGGLTAVTTADGRFTALMPHPERVFRNLQMSWTSGDIAEREPVAAHVRKRATLGGLIGRRRTRLRYRSAVSPTNQPAVQRFDRLDALRGVAIVWMALFHFGFDLNHFGWFSPTQNFYTDPLWTVQRSCIVSLFLFCAGLAQAVALQAGQGWPRFWRRWAQVAGCALLVSIGSALMFPQQLDQLRRAARHRRDAGAGAAGRAAAALAVAAGRAVHRRCRLACSTRSSMRAGPTGSAWSRTSRSPRTTCRCCPGWA